MQFNLDKKYIPSDAYTNPVSHTHEKKAIKVPKREKRNEAISYSKW